MSRWRFQLEASSPWSDRAAPERRRSPTSSGAFYDVTSGRVTVDGVDVRDWTVSSLRGAMGIVPQEIVLFHDTIAANIAYGARSATEQEIHRAARAANAHTFISALPEGYDMVVGERGTRLSGGRAPAHRSCEGDPLRPSHPHF